MSPEELGARFGASGMTVRRWLKKPAGFTIGEPYESAIHRMISHLINDGILDRESKSVAWSTSQSPTLNQEASIRLLGLQISPTGDSLHDDNQVLEALSRIGAGEGSLLEVQRKSKEIENHRGHSREWALRISTLTKALNSAQVPSVEKIIAIGALFYLVFPTDLIPDALPVFGLIDDFSILGVASTYYLPKLGKAKNERD